MGIFKTAKANAGMQTGKTTLTEETALGLDTQAITPTNPGDFGIHRTLPVFQKPGYMTQSQADQLKIKAAESKVRAKATEEGLKSAQIISESDTKVKVAHDNYLIHQAGTTFVQAASNGNRARQIASLQPRYAGLAQSLKTALGLNQAKVNGIGYETTERAKSFATTF